ncbi:MAG: hypothetical protein ACM3MD_12070 [Betaproteobacteria bacterium]
MKKWLSVVLTAGLLLYPFAGFAQDYGPQTSQRQQAPPVAQTLVREGDFAIKLAAELDLGNPANEAEAEDMLARAGVSPLNGWISDYPMTPEIIGQLGDSIAAAAGEGKLPMTAGEATKGLYSLASQMNLPTPAGPGPGTAPEGQSNPTVVNNYYYDQGPPIISYYPPPADYLYLYAWVPYPVFWWGFWWPGFFICHNFTTTVVVSNGVFVGRTAIVSNRFIDPVTRTVTRVDPVVRTSTGTVRPMTALRTGSGQLFRTATDMRRGATLSGVSPVRTGTAVSGKAAGTRGFKTLEARKGAQAIYSRSVQGMSVRSGPERTMMRSSGTRYTAPGGAGRSYSAPSRGSEGRSMAPTPSAPSRSYNRPMMRDGGGYGRSYVAPSAPQRSHGGSMIRGGGATTRPYRGTGWRGNGRM